jgi:uncharacterized protein
MNTSLKHLSQAQRDKLERTVRIIVRAVQPEKIILFGPASDAFDLLVVSRQGDRRTDYEMQDLIENRCREEAPVTALVHDIAYVNRRLAEGQYFFSVISKEGILLYDAHVTPLAKAAPPDLGKVRTIAMKDYQRWSRQGLAFFRSAGFNRDNQEWKVAAFLLHQAAEHIYQAILLAFTGYKPTTHNLDKLRRYTNRFSVELSRVFPRDNPAEDELFRRLLSGYVDARYKEEFSISEAEITQLLERIGRLIEIAERVCVGHLASLH